MNVGLFVVAVGACLVGAMLLQAAEVRGWRSSLVGLTLRFPRGLDEASVAEFLASLSGLLPPWWRRWLGVPFVVAEVTANARGIEHRLFVPAAFAATIENALQAHLPGLRYERLDDTSNFSTSVEVAAEYRLNTGQRQLRLDASALSSGLLSTLQPLDGREQVVVQWIVAPAGPVRPARVATASEREQIVMPSGVLTSSEDAAALRQKQAQPLLLGTARIGVHSRSLRRARALLRQVEAAWHPSRAPGVHLRRRLLSERRAARRLAQRAVPARVWPGVFNIEELSGLLGWPVEVEQIPGVVLGGCRALAPSPLIPTAGTVIGTSNFPGNARPVALELEGRLRHLHLVGPTGTGKSTLLLNLIAQDLAAGHGVVVIDPKGDLVKDVLARVPTRRVSDVIVLDPADDAYPVGLNPLRSVEGAHSEVVVENLVGLFKSLYRSSWGPRTDDILRASLLTLAGSNEATLCEVPLLLTDPAYRRRLIGNLDDPIGLESFWGWYEALSDAERLNVVGPVLNKVRAFTMRKRVRAIVGQADPALSIANVLDRGQVLLVSLASGLLGEEAAALLGALVFAEVWHATTARAEQSAGSRRPAMAHLDEWQHFLHLPTPMASVLAEARGLGLGLTLAHQHLGQLPNEIRDAVLANSRSRLAFQLPAQDARLLVREFGSGLSEDDLQGLGAFEVVAQLFAAGRAQPALTASTHPAPEASSDPVAVRDGSRERWGSPRAKVEASIRARQQGRTSEAPIGRKRRPRGSS